MPKALHTSEKAEESVKAAPPPKPPGYKKFEKLLKQVISAPPLRAVKKDQLVG